MIALRSSYDVLRGTQTVETGVGQSEETKHRVSPQYLMQPFRDERVVN